MRIEVNNFTSMLMIAGTNEELLAKLFLSFITT